MAKSKKALDRDMMFRKIMPALADNPYAAPVVDTAPVQAPAAAEDGPIPQSASPVPVPEAPAPPEPAQPRPVSLGDAPFTIVRTSSEKEDDLSVLRARLFARSDFFPGEPEQVSTVNLMESLVLTHLDEVIQRFNCCRCDRCRRDIAACSLNLLPPQYVVASPDKLDALAGTIASKSVYDALIKAVLKVRAEPHH